MGEPTTRTIKATEARQQFGKLIDEVKQGETRVLVERGGVAVAALVSADDLARLTQLDAQREEDFRALDATRRAFEDVPDEEIECEVARALGEIRARNRNRAQRSTKSA